MTDPSRRPCRGPQDAAQRVVFPPRSPRQTPTRPPPRETCGGRWSGQARRRWWCASRAAGDAKRQVESVSSRRLTTPRDSPPPCATRRATRHRGLSAIADARRRRAAESPRDQLACAAAAARHRTAARSALLRQTLAGRPGLTRQARARTPGPDRAAARRPRRGNARRVARRVTSPPPRVSRQRCARPASGSCRTSKTTSFPGSTQAGTPTRCHAEIEQQLDEIVAAPRGSNPRRPSRQPHSASNPRGDTSRDTSLSSSLSPADPTSTRSNSSIALDGADGQTDSPEQTRERRAPRLRSGASRSPPTRLLQSPPGGDPLFSRRKLVHLSTGLDKGEGLPDEALRAATRSAPRSSRSRLHREGGSIFERRKGVNFRAALTVATPTRRTSCAYRRSRRSGPR